MITKTKFWMTVRDVLRETARSEKLAEKVMKKIREQENKESESKRT